MNELELIEEELLTLTDGNNLVFGLTTTNNNNNDVKYNKINVRKDVKIIIFHENKNLNLLFSCLKNLNRHQKKGLTFCIRSDSSSKSLLDKIPNHHKQKAREVMGLCVALVLGFNIGGGNIRDSLRSGSHHP